LKALSINLKGYEMRIKTIVNQHRRDFTAIYECEHCGYEQEASGYDDDNFHVNVIPMFTCPSCKKSKHDSYVPRTTKYPADFVI